VHCAGSLNRVLPCRGVWRSGNNGARREPPPLRGRVQTLGFKLQTRLGGGGACSPKGIAFSKISKSKGASESGRGPTMEATLPILIIVTVLRWRMQGKNGFRRMLGVLHSAVRPPHQAIPPRKSRQPVRTLERQAVNPSGKPSGTRQQGVRGDVVRGVCLTEGQDLATAIAMAQLAREG